jgi:hypothetical protein
MFTCTRETFGHLISPLCVLCASVFIKFKTQRHREHGELVTEKVNKAANNNGKTIYFSLEYCRYF